VSYLSVHWLQNLRSWAVHVQTGLVHFGNMANNRLENANGRLKKHTHHADRLEHAVQVSLHAERLLQEYEVHAIYRCDKRLLSKGDFYVRRVLQRMTTYARVAVLRHLSGRVPSARYIRLRDHQVRFHFFHIYFSLPCDMVPSDML
jgi:hypothetical protein